MRIIRVRHKGQTFYASLGDGVVISMGRECGADPIPLPEVNLMPLVAPSKIVCIGYNFKEQAEAHGIKLPAHPVFFIRPTSSLSANSRPVLLPQYVRNVYAEGELALVIGQSCRRVSVDDATKHIFGYTCANDITIDDYRDDPFQVIGKAFNGTCPVGPWLETQAPDLNELAIRCLVNGEILQSGSTAGMLFSPAEIISYLSQIMTLNPGDIVLTGAPPGVAMVRPGDAVQVEIPSVGVLSNPIHSEEGCSLLQ